MRALANALKCAAIEPHSSIRSGSAGASLRRPGRRFLLSRSVGPAAGSSTYPSIHPSIFPAIHPSPHPLIPLLSCLSIPHPSIHPPIHPSTHPPIRPSLSLRACLCSIHPSPVDAPAAIRVEQVEDLPDLRLLRSREKGQ